MGEAPRGPAGGPVLDRRSVDGALRHRQEERDRIATELIDLEHHAVFQLLRGGRLSGRTARRWAAAETQLAGVWAMFDAYRQTLSRAEAIRASRARPGPPELAELAELLVGSSVRAPEAGPAAARRSLRPVAAPTLTLEQAVDRMEVAFRAVADLVTTVGTAWDELIAKLSDAETELAAVVDLHQRLAGPDPAPPDPEAARLTGELSRLRGGVMADPLAGDAADELDRLSATLTARRRELERAATVRETYQQRRAALRATLTRLTAAEAAAARDAEVVATKIAVPAPPVPPHPAGHLAGQLASRLAELDRPDPDWLARSRRLAELERAVEEGTRQVEAARDAGRRLLDRREELRGLLGAYQARAVRLGRAEEPEASRHHERARRLLWTAPCDLVQAERAVESFRVAVQRGGDDDRSG